MRLTRKKFSQWVNWVGVNNCNDVPYMIKAAFSKAMALKEYTLEAKLAKQKEAGVFWDNLSIERRADIAVMMMDVIATEKNRFAI